MNELSINQNTSNLSFRIYCINNYNKCNKFHFVFLPHKLPIPSGIAQGINIVPCKKCVILPEMATGSMPRSVDLIREKNSKDDNM
jgi:hypothetical protein